jgi:hypothetical protein
MSYANLKDLVFSVEYHHISHGTRWADFSSAEELPHRGEAELTENETNLLNNIIKTQGWSIADDLKEAKRLEIESINSEGRANKTYTLAFVGKYLWGCVPDGEAPFSKVCEELGYEFYEQFNPADFRIIKGITLTNSERLVNFGRLIYSGRKHGCLVDTDGKIYEYAVALIS